MAESTDIRELNILIEQKSEFVGALTAGMNRVIVGQKHLVETLLIGLLSDGHILLEGVPGLAKTFRGFSLRDGQKVILITIGLSDPDEPENRQNIRAALKKQLPPDLFHQAKIFHLRGGIDYQRLSLSHRTMLALLYRSLRKTPLEQQTAENRALIETYGKQVNFIDFGALEAVVREIQHEKTPHYCEVSNAEDGT